MRIVSVALLLVLGAQCAGQNLAYDNPVLSWNGPPILLENVNEPLPVKLPTATETTYILAGSATVPIGGEIYVQSALDKLGKDNAFSMSRVKADGTRDWLLTKPYGVGDDDGRYVQTGMGYPNAAKGVYVCRVTSYDKRTTGELLVLVGINQPAPEPEPNPQPKPVPSDSKFWIVVWRTSESTLGQAQTIANGDLRKDVEAKGHTVRVYWSTDATGKHAEHLQGVPLPAIMLQRKSDNVVVTTETMPDTPEGVKALLGKFGG